MGYASAKYSFMSTYIGVCVPQMSNYISVSAHWVPNGWQMADISDEISWTCIVEYWSALQYFLLSIHEPFNDMN